MDAAHLVVAWSAWDNIWIVVAVAIVFGIIYFGAFTTRRRRPPTTPPPAERPVDRRPR